MNTGGAAHATFFMANEPLAGKRMVEIVESRTKVDWALFVEKIASCYEDAEKITLVMDNLNTTKPGSLYECFVFGGGQGAFGGFEFRLMPKQWQLVKHGREN